MNFDTLKQALNDPETQARATESARTAAASANQESCATIARMDEKVQLEVAKAAGANVELRPSGSKK